MYPPIFEKCRTDQAVVSIFGARPVRLWPFGEAPQGTGVPYAVWQTISGTPENYLGTAPDIDQYSIQIDVYAKTGEAARNGALALRNVIQTHAHIAAWRGESKDSETGNYRFTFDVDWFVNR
jgi:hypothetical protein